MWSSTAHRHLAETESADVLLSLVAWRFFGFLDLLWTFVDVGDVSLSHILLMELDSVEERYICGPSDKPVHLREVAKILLSKGYNPPMRDLTSSWITFIKTPSYLLPRGQAGHYTRNHLGAHLITSNAKIVKDLGNTFREPKTVIEGTITDLVKWGHLPSSQVQNPSMLFLSSRLPYFYVRSY